MGDVPAILAQTRKKKWNVRFLYRKGHMCNVPLIFFFRKDGVQGPSVPFLQMVELTSSMKGTKVLVLFLLTS